MWMKAQSRIPSWRKVLLDSKIEKGWNPLMSLCSYAYKDTSSLLPIVEYNVFIVYNLSFLR